MDKKFVFYKNNGQWGYSDTKNTFVGLKYDGIRNLKNGFSVVLFNSEYGYIDENLEEITDIKYSSADDFCEDRALVSQYQKIGCVNTQKKGFIDTTGKEIIPLIYKEAFSFNGGIAVVKLGDLWGGIDAYNIDVIHFDYDFLDGFNEDFARARIGKKWGFIDRKGNELVSFKYYEVQNFRDGLALVRDNENRKYGFIDRSGNEVITCKYDNAENFYAGNAKVVMNNKSGSIDKNGAEDWGSSK